MSTTPTTSDNHRLVHNGWRGWLVLYGAWSVPALMGTGATILAGYGTPDVPVWHNLVRQLWYYWFFASLCPLLYRASGRFPFAKPHWPAAVVTHFGLATLVVLLIPFLEVIIDWLLGPTPDPLFQGYMASWSSPQAPFRAFIACFYYVMAAGAVILVRLSRSRQEAEERQLHLELHTLELQAQLTQARLAALKSQLRPHFLFNALNTVSALAKSGDSELTVRTIARLGDLLRATLELPEDETVALSRELELVEQYLGLERLRFADRLETSYELEDDVRSVPVPALILQPLVENSIRHGVARSEGTTRLVIRARRDNGHIQLQVDDSGPGFSAHDEATGNGGVGLTNVRQRLHTKYGERAKLSVGQSDTGGASVRLTIPLDDDTVRSDI